MLNGPELDLLQEVLAEDPTADIYLDVAAALVERQEWTKASRILRRAIEGGIHDIEAARMLAVAAGKAQDFVGVGIAVKHIGRDVVASDPELARSWALALDAQGQLEQAGQLASQLLTDLGPDAALSDVIKRQMAPPPDPRLAGRDPWLTVNRAEAYLEAGRIDMAVRLYRRIHAHHPTDSRVHARMLRLSSMPRDSRPWIDDLSEEYWSSSPMKSLIMPASTLVPLTDDSDWDGDDENTDRVRVPPIGIDPLHLDVESLDDEATVIFRSRALPPELAIDNIRDLDAPSQSAFDDEEDTQTTGPLPGLAKRRSKRSQRKRSSPIEEQATEAFRVTADAIIEEARSIERSASKRGRSPADE